jgi:hypothetical protein
MLMYCYCRCSLLPVQVNGENDTIKVFHVVCIFKSNQRQQFIILNCLFLFKPDKNYMVKNI